MNVEFDDVTVSLGGRPVVQNVSAHVETGQFVGLIGPNGSGKSTLLRTLYRAVKPRGGAARVGGRDVRAFSGRQLARAVSVMLQDAPTEFDLSVDETVMLGRAPHHASFGRDSISDRRVVADAMSRTDTLELANRMVATLSGGQRQRVMLARALAQDTPVMLLDEPSNHLDISHQHELMTTVRELGVTVIAALHDLNLAAQYCDQVLVLADGRLVAAGRPVDVLTPALIRSTFGVDVRILRDAWHPVFAFCARERPPLSARPSPNDAERK